MPVMASASVTIQWNTKARAPAVSQGTVVSVKDRVVTLRLADGSVRSYTASAEEAAALSKLVGKTIAFREHR